MTAPNEIKDVIYIPFLHCSKVRVSFYNMEISRLYLITNSLPQWNTNVYYRGAAAGNKIALTFDDGPDDYYTPKILDILGNKKFQLLFCCWATNSVVSEYVKSYCERGTCVRKP